jgi:hypothetical protein
LERSVSATEELAKKRLIQLESQLKMAEKEKLRIEFQMKMQVYEVKRLESIEE